MLTFDRNYESCPNFEFLLLHFNWSWFLHLMFSTFAAFSKNWKRNLHEILRSLKSQKYQTNIFSCLSWPFFLQPLTKHYSFLILSAMKFWPLVGILIQNDFVYCLKRKISLVKLSNFKCSKNPDLLTFGDSYQFHVCFQMKRLYKTQKHPNLLKLTFCTYVGICM